MSKIIKWLLKPFRAWGKAYDKSLDEIYSLEEPHRSMLLSDIFQERGS